MSRVKDIVIKVRPANVANTFVKKYHYSGKIVNNSSLHFGCFLDGKLHGVMSYGPSTDKRKMMGLVKTENEGVCQKWNEFLELNRMAFDDILPSNSESRCLAISFRLIKKYAPQIKYIISFSDATASGDGTIYRAAGFLLTQIRENNSIVVMPDGERVSRVSISVGFATKKRLAAKYGIPLWSGASLEPLMRLGAKEAKGYQLRYIKLLSSDCELQVPVVPFSKIDEIGAGMYRGKNITQAERHAKTKEKV